MNSAIERLLTLRVGDLMSRRVVPVEASANMSEAARVLNEHNVSGAPVVDEQGRCVGMLSGRDFVRREALPEEPHLSHEAGHPIEIEEPSGLVSAYMSSAVQTVQESATMIDAARCLCGEHIHRLVVLDEHERPVGMLSALDLVAAMVKAVEE